MPKFNVTWIYTIIIIALAILFFTGGGNALGGDSSASQTATYTQFKKYVAKGYAKSVVVIKPDNKLKMFVNASLRLTTNLKGLTETLKFVSKDPISSKSPAPLKA